MGDASVHEIHLPDTRPARPDVPRLARGPGVRSGRVGGPGGRVVALDPGPARPIVRVGGAGRARRPGGATGLLRDDHGHRPAGILRRRVGHGDRRGRHRGLGGTQRHRGAPRGARNQPFAHGWTLWGHPRLDPRGRPQLHAGASRRHPGQRSHGPTGGRLQSRGAAGRARRSGRGRARAPDVLLRDERAVRCRAAVHSPRRPRARCGRGRGRGRERRPAPRLRPRVGSGRPGRLVRRRQLRRGAVPHRGRSLPTAGHLGDRRSRAGGGRAPRPDRPLRHR